MAYTYTQFGSTDLPNLEGSHDISSGSARVNIMDLPGGGAYDATGGANDRGERGAQKIGVAGILLQSDLAAAYYPLRALVGTRAQLWRTRDDGTTKEWAYARLDNIRSTRRQKNLFYLEIDMQFVVLSPCWFSETETVLSYLDAGANDDDLTTTGAESGDVISSILPGHGGNFPNRGTVVEITVISGTITAVSIQNTASVAHTLAWSGSLTVGDVLTIDCGALSVLDGATDAYSGLTPPTTVDGWLILWPDPSSNSMTVTLTGGAANVEFSFYDAWV